MVNRRMATKALMSFVGLPFARASYAIDDQRVTLEKALKRVREDFDKQRQVIKLAILGEYDRRIRGVNSIPGLTAGAKNDRKIELAEAKKTFERDATFPPGDIHNDLALKFVTDTYTMFERSDKTAAKIIGDATKKKLPEMVSQGEKLRNDLAQEMASIGNFTAGSIYRGTMTKPNGQAIPYHIRFIEVGGGGSFKGHVEDNPGVGGNWSYNMAGQANGPAYEFGWTKSTRGPISSIYAQGFLCGNRLFGQLRQTVGTNPPVSMQLILRLT